ncbi:glycosyltransferase family 2 protein [Thermohalobacter berrensis]|uniref:Glycosyl transferase n=1 Tax=Thermohalobacter berrensis TaxID=99594 RepID=A0A419TAP8_9FIRM|nr:glycosyltransferase family 2 protein [Thermohalobacter berrensis]RKD34556.1 glycosyl transferase [Thermohalobacter berrensis]
MYKDKRIAAIIPVFNEEKKILNTINGLQKLDFIDSILVVDDGSTDNSADIAQKCDVKVIKLGRNYGKGFAIKAGISNVEADYIVLLDADLGKTSYEISKLIYSIFINESDFVIAKFPNPKIKGGFGFVKKLAKLGVYLYTREKIESVLSGQRIYKKEVINDITYIPNDYGIEIAMTIEALKKGYKVTEVDVDMHHNETGRNLKGFLHRGKQFFHILRTLLVLSFKIR